MRTAANTKYNIGGGGGRGGGGHSRQFACAVAGSWDRVGVVCGACVPLALPKLSFVDELDRKRGKEARRWGHRRAGRLVQNSSAVFDREQCKTV